MKTIYISSDNVDVVRLYIYIYTGQFARISTNLSGLEVNDHVNLQWLSYLQPHDLNLRL